MGWVPSLRNIWCSCPLIGGTPCGFLKTEVYCWSTICTAGGIYWETEGISGAWSELLTNCVTCNNSPCVGGLFANSLLPCMLDFPVFIPCNKTFFPWYVNPISNFSKSQLITPKVLSHWVPKTIQLSPNSNKLKSIWNWWPYTLTSSPLISPLMLMTPLLATLTLKDLVVSMVNLRFLAKFQSRKLWVLPVSSSTIAFYYLILEITLIVLGAGLPRKAFNVISGSASSTSISSSHSSSSESIPFSPSGTIIIS